jgi:hypothetical protein
MKNTKTFYRNSFATGGTIAGSLFVATNAMNWGTCPGLINFNNKLYIYLYKSIYGVLSSGWNPKVDI